MSYVFRWVPSLIKLQPEKKVTVVWPLVGMFGGSISSDCFGGFLDQITTGKNKQMSGNWLQCPIVLAGLLLCFLAGSSIKLQIMTRKKGTVVWLPYTICNTRNILFFLCLYLKRGNKLNVGIVWFEGKAPSQTSKTCLTMVELFAGPSNMAMGNQPMPSRYPLCKRLSKGRVQGFLLTL